MPGPLQVSLDRGHRRWRGVLFPVMTAAQHRKHQIRQPDQPDLMPALFGPGRIGVSDGMAKTGRVGVGMTVDEGNTQGHGASGAGGRDRSSDRLQPLDRIGVLGAAGGEH